MDRPGGAVGIVVVSVSAQNPSPATCSETRTPKALREALEASMAYSCPVLTSSSKEYVQAKTDRWEERKTRPRRTLTDGMALARDMETLYVRDDHEGLCMHGCLCPSACGNKDFPP